MQENLVIVITENLFFIENSKSYEALVLHSDNLNFPFYINGAKMRTEWQNICIWVHIIWTVFFNILNAQQKKKPLIFFINNAQHLPSSQSCFNQQKKRFVVNFSSIGQQWTLLTKEMVYTVQNLQYLQGLVSVYFEINS